jgi:predicted transporter
MTIEPEALATSAQSAIGSTKAFLLAHPVGVAVVGGVLIGLGAYYIAKKWSAPKEETAKA